MKSVILYTPFSMLRFIRVLVIVVLHLVFGNYTKLHAQDFAFSEGLYRIGYQDGTPIYVVSDVWTHSPLGYYDITTELLFPDLVAAADGWVRWFQEDFNVECHPNGNGEPCCDQFNNYLVMEHPNGEWSNYTHMLEGSVTNAGIEVGDWITAGTPIGVEGSVGCSTEPHLHFEVRRPPLAGTPFDTIGGFLSGEALLPVICGILPFANYLQDSDVFFAAPCEDTCPGVIEVAGSLGFNDEKVSRASSEILTDNANDVEYASGSVAQFRSGGSIRLRPGFHAQGGTHFQALITGCNASN